MELGRTVQAELSSENLRIYTNDDVVGTELGGSVKNVMAIAAGMVAGLGFGSNSIAALITRGLAEMTRLAVKEGAKLETLMGLAGLGDLVLTCTGNLSRNRFVGQELGKGRSLKEITSGMKEVAEGVKTTQALKRLATRLGVEMPITSEVHAVLYEGADGARGRGQPDDPTTQRRILEKEFRVRLEWLAQRKKRLWLRIAPRFTTITFQISTKPDCPDRNRSEECDGRPHSVERVICGCA